MIGREIARVWGRPRLHRRRKNRRSRSARRPSRLPMTIPAIAPVESRDALSVAALLPPTINEGSTRRGTAYWLLFLLLTTFNGIPVEVALILRVLLGSEVELVPLDWPLVVGPGTVESLEEPYTRTKSTSTYFPVSFPGLPVITRLCSFVPRFCAKNWCLIQGLNSSDDVTDYTPVKSIDSYLVVPHTMKIAKYIPENGNLGHCCWRRILARYGHPQ